MSGVFMQLSDQPKLMDGWCNRSLGRRFQEWYAYDIDDKKRVYAFKDEATLLIFKLTWSYNEKSI